MDDATNADDASESDADRDRQARRIRRIVLYSLAALICLGVGTAALLKNMSDRTPPPAPPPVLRPEHEKELAKLMSEFPNQRVAVLVSDDPLSIELGQVLLPILSNAKWEMTTKTPKIGSVSETGELNVTVSPDDEKSGKTPKAALTLAAKLKQLGINSDERLGTDADLATGEIGLRVRAKPVSQ